MLLTRLVASSTLVDFRPRSLTVRTSFSQPEMKKEIEVTIKIKKQPRDRAAEMFFIWKRLVIFMFPEPNIAQRKAKRKFKKAFRDIVHAAASLAKFDGGVDQGELVVVGAPTAD